MYFFLYLLKCLGRYVFGLVFYYDEVISGYGCGCLWIFCCLFLYFECILFSCIVLFIEYLWDDCFSVYYLVGVSDGLSLNI